MKKIIKNKAYDTETARRIATGCCRSSHPGDYAYWTEELYQKKTGEFFLFGQGGPASRYAEPAGLREWSGGCRIMPLTYEEAREWAEKELDADEYIRIFGDPEADADEGTEVMTISVPASVARRIRMEAQKSGATISGTIASKFGA